jgi:hypothetical protein
VPIDLPGASTKTTTPAASSATSSSRNGAVVYGLHRPGGRGSVGRFGSAGRAVTPKGRGWHGWFTGRRFRFS